MDGAEYVEPGSGSPRTDLPAGNYALEDNITFGKNINIKTGTVNLCLNGKTLEAGGDLRVDDGQTLTLSDCGDGRGVRRTGRVAYVCGSGDSLGELVVESGKLVNTQADTADYPDGAIGGTGYITLRGGEVSGPYGVDFTYTGQGYTRPPLTLAGAPKVSGSIADIHILYDETDLTSLALVDATDYTGRAPLSVEFALNDGGIGDYLGLPIVKLDSTPASKFSLTNEGYTLTEEIVDGVNCLVLAVQPPHSHDMSAECGSDAPVTFGHALTCDETGTLCVDGTALEAKNSGGIGYVELPAGSYYLAQDVTQTCQMRINGEVNLCLNGHQMNFKDSSVQSIFYVRENGTLNLCDCNGSQGSHSFTSPVTGEAVTVQGGLVTGGRLGTGASFNGAAAYVCEGGVMNLYGGAVGGNGDAGNSVGAVYVYGTFVMYGGTVCHNTSKMAGGVYIKGTASILGGEISRNAATSGNGGGILLDEGGNLTLGGNAAIQDNTAAGFGGGVRAVKGSRSLTFTGAPTVVGNTAGGKADNVWLGDGVRADATGMTGGGIGVTTQTAPTAGNPVEITTANSADLSSCFSSDKEDYEIANGENNVVRFAVKPAAHTHTWDTAWSGDAAHHWHECTAEGCDVTENAGKDGYAAHVYTDDRDIDCDTCGYERTVPLYGTVTVTGTARIGETLTAGVTGGPGGVELTYAWICYGVTLGTGASYVSSGAGEVGKSLTVRVTAGGSRYTGSIETAAGPVGKGGWAAPAGLFTVTDIPYGASEGSIAITGDAAQLEWRVVTDAGDGVWTAVAAEGGTATLNALAGGSYEFRYKETATHNASPATQVQVRVLSPEAKGLTIDPSIVHGTVTKGRDRVNPGDTVTLAVRPDPGYELSAIAANYDDGEDRTIVPAVKPDNAAQYTFTMPNADVTVTAVFTAEESGARGEVEVKPGTPAVAVDEEALEELAGTPAPGERVTVTLTVEKKAESAAENADAIKQVAGGQTLEFLDLSLVRTVTGGADPGTTNITDTHGKVLEIQVSYDFTGKKNVTVYRYHDGGAERLVEADTGAGGTFKLGGGSVTIYATKFSTYAIGYTEETATPASRPGGGSSAVYYTLTATAGQGGTVTPGGRVSVRRDGAKTFTITPDEGYVVADVLVDGRSVGAVTEYTFERVTAGHTIEAGFRRADPRPAWNPFEDVEAGSWFHDSVRYVYERGLMEGIDSTHFAPGMTTSRAMIATVLWRLAGSPEPGAQPAYTDCNSEAYYARAVAWATEQGVAEGCGNGSFGPGAPITREQLAAMLWHYAGRPAASGTLDGFSDAGRAGTWAVDALRWAVGEGILQGKGGGRLDPAGQATRAETAAMLKRLGGNGR